MAEAGQSYMEHMGKYPVISLSLKSAKQPNFNMAYQCMVQDIAYEYDRHRYVLNGDVPLENSYFRGFYSEMIDFIRSLFESALKTNGSLEFAVITGCLRISKETLSVIRKKRIR